VPTIHSVRRLIAPLLLFLTTFGSGWAIAVPSAHAGDTSTVTPEPYCTPSIEPVATPDEILDQVFSYQLGPGWVGGDSTYSTELPDLQTAFVFSDTLIGSATLGGSARITGIAHNSELLGALPSLHSDYGGSYLHPQPLVPDYRGHGDEWQLAATYVENGHQLVFVNEFHPRKGPFASYTGRSGIAVLTLHKDTPSFSSIVSVPTSPHTQWGNAEMEQGPYMYVYGTTGGARGGRFRGMKLVRVSRDSSLHSGAWRYWDGSGWAPGERHAAILHTGNQLTGVVPSTGPNGYEAVSIPGSVLKDKTVDLSYACSPQGPWSKPAPVYSIPQARIRDEIAYIPTFHPELSGDGTVVISYNVNRTDPLQTLARRVRDYQPKFLQLAPSRLVDSDLPVITVDSTATSTDTLRK
jgi:hypothetical protein